MSASQKLQAIVKALNITQVLVLDEAHSPDLAPVMVNLERLRYSKSPTDLEAKTRLSKINFDESEDAVWRSDVQMWWDELSVSERRSEQAYLDKQSPQTEEVTGSNSGIYAQFWESWPKEGCPIQFLVPEEWDQRLDDGTLLQGSDTVLAMLDLNLGENDSEGGAARLSKMFSVAPIHGGQHRVIPVVFTNEATSEEDELPLWNKLVSSHGLQQNLGLVMSKKRMRKPDRFAKRLAEAAMTATARHVGGVIARWYGELANTARINFQEAFDGDLFERVVIRASDEEGIHPQAMLFRLMDLYVRRERTPLNDAIANELSSYLQEVKELGATFDSEQIPKGLKILRALELYSKELGAGASTMPPWLGDVWRIQLSTGEEQRYIHIGQPCDLQIRPDGQRASQYFIFAPLMKGACPSSSADICTSLHYFPTTNAEPESYCVRFKETVIVNPDLLDAMALGGGRFDLERLSSCGDLNYSHLMSGVVLRYKSALSAIGLDVINGTPPALSHPPRLFLTGSIREKWRDENGVFMVCAEREARLEGTHAVELLRQYANCLQRMAHDVDFAKVRAGRRNQ